MVSADALTIFSGIIILFRNSGKSADFPELPFHGRSHNRKRKHSRGGVNVLPASTSLSSTTPSHENGVRKHPQAFLNPKIKAIISLTYAQSKRGAHSKSSHTAGVCSLFYPFIGTKPTRSLTTSPPMMSPATDGTKALEPGTERRWVHLRWVPGGQMQ